MDHEAYEKEMIEAINRHHDEVPTKEPVAANWSMVMNKNDTRTVVRGLKRTLLALLTATLFAISVIGIITVATVPGYAAVLLFFASILGLAAAFVLLYAQGITHIGRKGDSK
jgi:hypothetical protein